MRTNLYFTGGLLAATFVVGTTLSCSIALADDIVDDVSLSIPVSCSLSGTNLTHTATIQNYIYEDDIGSANIKALCNDTSGFAIYAIGYTNDEYGNNKMHSSTAGTTDINTGKYVSGTTTDSVWSMKLAPVTGTYAPTIRSDSTYDFTDYEVVPSEYTKVVSYLSATDAGPSATGSNFTSTYAVYMGGDQTAGTYTGQVKYTLVHPNTAPTPITPPAPLSTCSTPVPGFTYMQEINDATTTATAMSNMTDNAQYYLRDRRDEKPYCVSKIKTKNTNDEDQYAIWMTQNLRITGTIPAEGSNFTGNDVNISECDLDSTVGECPEASNRNSYDIAMTHDSGNTTNGVWYNYAAASAKTIVGDSNTTIDTENICPAGWTLPSNNTNKLAGSINSLAAIDSATYTAFSPVAGGYYTNGSKALMRSGFWWSTATVNITTRNYLYWDDGNSLKINGRNRYYGVYIRCVRAS